MPAAIPLAIYAGSAIAGAAITAHASGKAADQQTQAANNSLGLQRDVFNQQQAALNPFINLGTAAMGRYNQAYGGAPAGAYNSVGPTVAPGHAPMTGSATPTGPLVRVQAPTGEIAMLPQSQAQIAVSKGARLLDSGGANGPQTHIPLGY